MRPIIIGAGPVGSYVATMIKELNPLLIERKKEVGIPVQCTGLVSTRLRKLTPYPDDIIRNKVKGAVFYSKNEKAVIKSRKVMAHVIDRAAYDKWMFKRYDGESRLGEEFLRYDEGRVYTNKGKYDTSLLIDCSGPKRGLVGVQAVAGLQKDTDLVELYFDVVPDFFGWVVPVNKRVCRIGLATAQENPMQILKHFLKRLGAGKVREWNAGLIPMKVEEFVGNGLIRVGDAAGQVKAISGGGLVTGISSAGIAAEAVKEGFAKNDFSRKFFRKTYCKKWKKTIGRELRVHSLVRRYLNSLGEKGYDELIRFIKRNKDIIVRKGDMDYPLRLVISLLRIRNLPFFAKALFKLLASF